jgi:hypothetical protein
MTRILVVEGKLSAAVRPAAPEPMINTSVDNLTDIKEAFSNTDEKVKFIDF